MKKVPLARQNIRELKPYSSARSEYSDAGGVLLDANENSFGSVLEPGLNRYPDPLQKELKSMISRKNGVPPESIFIGNGSDEAIDLLIRSFCEPREDKILIFPPTYGIYSVFAHINEVAVAEIPLTQKFQLDLDAYVQADTSKIKITFICSPNNPSGNLINHKDILSILQSSESLVVVDEASFDFSASKSYIERLRDFPNLIVLQTLSKAWGLAGIRLGMAYGDRGIIEILNKIKYPYNISRVTQGLALKALESADQKDQYVSLILEQKKYLESELIKLKNVVRIFPSDANFLLVHFKEARKVYERLLLQQIIVRDRSAQIRCANCLRITVGSEPENRLLIKALKELEKTL